MRLLYLTLLFIILSCKKESTPQLVHKVELSIQQKTSKQTIINPKGKTIETRFNTPQGFTRTNEANHTFASYLRELPLKNHGSEVQFYNGHSKPNYNVYEAVVNLPIGKKDLHQCADAVMRLRAEYLWNEKRYNDIHFNFTNGFKVEYSKYKEGNRMVVKGNKTYWTKRAQPSNSYANFWKYMELIFTYSGTLSLAKELQPVPISDLQIGDIFIQGGSPGHAVIVVDMAINSTTGEKAFLLAQSYMPAQETQVLKNPLNLNNPWYYINEIDTELNTPEWTFSKNDLKRFK